MSESDQVILGRVSGVFGVRGWIKVYSHTSPPEQIFNYPLWLLGDSHKAYAVAEKQRHGKGLIARLEDITDRDVAATLLNQDIAIDRAELPSLASDEYYWTDLVGLAVETVDGIALGQIDSMIDNPAHDVMVIRGERERLVPFVRGEIVKSIDVEAGIVRVEWDPEF